MVKQLAFASLLRLRARRDRLVCTLLFQLLLTLRERSKGLEVAHRHLPASRLSPCGIQCVSQRHADDLWHIRRDVAKRAADGGGRQVRPLPVGRHFREELSEELGCAVRERRIAVSSMGNLLDPRVQVAKAEFVQQGLRIHASALDFGGRLLVDLVASVVDDVARRHPAACAGAEQGVAHMERRRE
eukprot:1927216-Prymnesium_polylepis.2